MAFKNQSINYALNIIKGLGKNINSVGSNVSAASSTIAKPSFYKTKVAAGILGTMGVAAGVYSLMNNSEDTNYNRTNPEDFEQL